MKEKSTEKIMKGQFFLLGALLLISAFFLASTAITEVFLMVPDRDMDFLSDNIMEEYPAALNLGLNSTIGGVPALANFSRFLNTTLTERYIDYQALWMVCENVSTDANITVGNWIHVEENVTLSIGGTTKYLIVPANSSNSTLFTNPGANFTLNTTFSQSKEFTVSDSFTDETRISVKENLTVDTTAGEVKLSRAACAAGHTDNGDGTCTVTLNDPTEDGFIQYSDGSYTRSDTFESLRAGSTLVAPPLSSSTRRIYIEWDISSVPDDATINDVVFKYHGYVHNIDCHIHEMLGARPFTSSNQSVYDEAGEGTVYTDPDGFPEEGTNKQVDLESSAETDLQNQLSSDWFAIGIQSDSESTSLNSHINSEENTSADPKPTLEVTYTPGYEHSGELRSTNLLSSKNVSSIDSFGYTASSIPTGTGLKAQFSKDNTSWYNSTGSLSGWDSLSQGSHTVDLSSLGWSIADFYYKIEFTSDGSDTPILNSISTTYTSYESFDWWRDKVSLYVYMNMTRGDNVVIQEDDY